MAARGALMGQVGQSAASLTNKQLSLRKAKQAGCLWFRSHSVAIQPIQVAVLTATPSLQGTHSSGKERCVCVDVTSRKLRLPMH